MSRKEIRTPHQRRSLIVQLLEAGHGNSQVDLVEALAARGVDVTQATLSRDLKELGALKGADGYQVPGGATDPLAQALGQWLVSVTQAQNTVVLRTPPGGASPLAVVLDANAPAEVVGTIAGDDTILVITPTSGAAKKLTKSMGRYARGQS